MSLESLYFNITKSRFVRGSTSVNSVSPPVWGQSDVRDFGVTFVQTNELGRSQVLTTIVAAKVNVSEVAVPGTVLTSNTASSVTNNEHAFLLTLRGYLDTAMTDETSNVLFAGQFFLSMANGGENSYPFEVYISPKQGTTSTPDTTIPDGFYTKSETGALFLPKEVPVGTRLLWTDEGTGQVRSVGFRDGIFGPLDT